MKIQGIFSVVMAVRNGGATLTRALDSLMSQTCGDWECLIQDGMSDDNTEELLAARQDKRLKVAREADSGVYDAWNKALGRLSPESCWVMFLGADDALADPYVLARASHELVRLPEDVMFAQAGLNVGRDGKKRECISRSRAEVFQRLVWGMPLLTPAVFFRTSLFRQANFDSTYRIAGDFAFVAERLAPANFAVLPFVASYMELGGLSSSLRTRSLLQAERRRVLAECVLPRAAEIVQACIETLDETADPMASVR